MNRTISSFLLVAVLAGALAALSTGLQIKGYASYGQLGLGRLDGLASSSTFIPLAAIYSLAAALMMILPLRTAGFMHANGATPVFHTALILLATIVGVQAARLAFGNSGALWILLDWQFVFAAAIIAAHLVMSWLRKNVLLRTIFFLIFVVATLACLYWTFRL